MRLLSMAAFAVILLSAGGAYANPPVIAVAEAAAQAVGVGGEGTGIGVGGESMSTGIGGDSSGFGVGGDSSGTGGNASSKDNSTTIGAALGQAPSAITGICGKDNKFAFGALQWSDFSSKCFNYMIAIEAAKKGEWELAHQWVVRADQM